MVKIKSVHDLIIEVSPYYKKRFERTKKMEDVPESQHLLIYDSPAETLEPIYFFLLDLMGDMGLKIQKVEDNFSSSVGSGHFSEFGQRLSIMQQQGTKLLADINTVLRSVLNIIYDLREFKIRLQSYDDLKDSEKKEAATLSLKQLWMDKVDMQKGNSGIKAMALGQAGFNTLLDAFLIVKDDKDVDKLDLNQVVKRILKPRIHEFNSWVKHSEGELRKRFEIEKTYLRSQVNSLKLYSRWAKPYLKAAQELEQRDNGKNPALVKAFNTVVLEMTLLGKRGQKIKEVALAGGFPREFSSERFINKLKRRYNGITILDFSFRSIPQKVQGQAHYAFGGRADVTFSSYALNDEELKNLDILLEKSDLNSALTLVEGTTEESLAQLQTDIDYFLEDKSEEKKSKDQSNPFSALFGRYNKEDKKSEKKKEEKEEPKLIDIKPDNWYEENYFRKAAIETAKEDTYTLFETYKKANRMPTPAWKKRMGD